MKRISFFVVAIISNYCFAQNVGIGTTTPTENLHVVGNKVLLENNFVGVGVGAPVTPYSYFQVNKNVNTFAGMYINTGATGQPFYGYALNGVAAAYHQLNGSNGQYEYYHSNSSIPDFQIGNTNSAFPNTSFLGIGTTTPTTPFTGITLKKNVNNFFGMYVDAGATGQPFYGYALNGVAAAYHQLNGSNGQYEYYHSNGGIPDFQIGNTNAAFPNANFLGIGTTTPTTSFTGLTLKNNVNTYFGTYVDAGATGTPFYGYALNGTATAYTAYNGNTNRFEYHHTTDITPDFAVSNTQALFPIQTFLGLGTSTPTTGFTGLTLKNNVNTFYGAYVDAGATGIPFYGYALNGTATAYTTFNGNTNQFEYHHTTDATPDFSVSNTQVSFPIQNTLTIGTATPINSATGLTLTNPASTGYYGMYINTSNSGEPFYGYALNGVPKAWTEFNSSTSNWELNYNGARLDVTSSGNIGVGTASPTAKLSVNGTANNTTGSWGVFSDERIKTVEADFDDGINVIQQMHPVKFIYNNKAPFSDQNVQIGVVAQELEKIAPYMVAQKEIGQFKDLREVNNQAYVFLLINAIKQQQKQLADQKAENDYLKNKYELLVKRVELLERR